MKAIVYDSYGPPEVLRVAELARPEPAENEVLIAVRAATVASEDCIFRRGSPWVSRLATGLLRPKHAVLGSSLAGEIVAVGSAVTHFQVGDRVFGATSDGFGAYAEYHCLAEDGALVPIPGKLDYTGAASVAAGGLTALPFLRDCGRLQPGERVLVNGAAGSVGSAAVQLARQRGAEVAAVCSERNAELVRSLGASVVIDYTQVDYAAGMARYDIVFDAIGKSSYAQARRVLRPGGRYLSPVLNLSILRNMLTTRWFGDRRALITFTGLRPNADKAADLHELGRLAAAGDYLPVIDRSWPLAQIVEAHRYVESGHKRGNVVLDIGH